MIKKQKGKVVSVFSKKQKGDTTNHLVVSNENTFYIKVPYEYPFSIGDDALRRKVKELIEEYNKIYRATNLIVYIQKGEFQDSIKSKVADLENLINQGNNELSRRTNERILKKSLWISAMTLFIAATSCAVTVCRLIK